MAEFNLTCRLEVTANNLTKVRSECSPSSKFVYVTGPGKRPAVRLRVHTLKGVPGKHLDLLLPDESPESIIACEVGTKAGSFDGVKRWRLTFRPWPTRHIDGKRSDFKHPTPGRVVLDLMAETTDVIVRWEPNGMWAQAFPRLRFVVEGGDRRGILLHQWKGWYKFLPEDDVRQLAELWSLLPHTIACDDIVVLNRTASQALYDLATNLGWRKLTLKDRLRIGLGPDSQQWQRVERIDRLRNGLGSVNGCGQYTIDAANGRRAMRTSYGEVEA